MSRVASVLSGQSPARLACSVLLLSLVVTCVGGGRKYAEGLPKDAVAEFAAPDCQITTSSGVPVSESRFFLVHGRTSFEFLALNDQGTGTRIENHQRKNGEHRFAAYKSKARAWVYSFPDKRGEKGKLEHFQEFDLVKHEEFTDVEGEPADTCVLEYVGRGEADQPDEQEGMGEAQEASVADSNAACIPGETRECVGPGACRGGHACKANGSGFGLCDCGQQTETSDAGSDAVEFEPGGSEP